MRTRAIDIPALVRIKPGALDRAGIYLAREGFEKALIISSHGLPASLEDRLLKSLSTNGVASEHRLEIKRPSLESVVELADTRFATLGQQAAGSAAEGDAGRIAVVGLGGGKALDAAKYLSHRLQLPYYAIPTSLSNDGFCSPQSSMLKEGRRVSVPATIPYAVVVDTQVCLQAPKRLWLSGVGDLTAKFTAVRDWKRAFHRCGTRVDDFAALLSDASVYQFVGCPTYNLQGMRLLATALMLNGVSMAVAGTSRPASGSEHLISHALDALHYPPKLHGLQVGLATFLISKLYGEDADLILGLFDETGFWQACQEIGFSKANWRLAIQQAPSMKSDFYTILSEPDQVTRLLEFLDQDPHVNRCFTEGH